MHFPGDPRIDLPILRQQSGGANQTCRVEHRVWIVGITFQERSGPHEAAQFLARLDVRSQRVTREFHRQLFTEIGQRHCGRRVRELRKDKQPNIKERLVPPHRVMHHLHHVVDAARDF